MSQERNEAPVQNEHVERVPETKTISESANLTSANANSAVKEMEKSGRQNSQSLLSSWNNFSIDGSDSGHKVETKAGEAAANKEKSGDANRSNSASDSAKKTGGAQDSVTLPHNEPHPGTPDKAATPKTDGVSQFGKAAGDGGHHNSPSAPRVGSIEPSAPSGKSSSDSATDNAKKMGADSHSSHGQMNSASSDAVTKAADAVKQQKEGEQHTDKPNHSGMKATTSTSAAAAMSAAARHGQKGSEPQAQQAQQQQQRQGLFGRRRHN